MRLIRAFLAFTFLFTFAVSALWAEKVRYVIDGDTFILENNLRVRMIGINAPEIGHRRYKKKGQAYGDEAKAHLKTLIEKKDVTLKSGGNDEYDRFGRRLAYVYLADGSFVNLRMIEDGFAEAYRKFPFEHKEDFIKSEQEARTAKKGMWSGKQGSSPMSGFWKMFGISD